MDKNKADRVTGTVVGILFLGIIMAILFVVAYKLISWIWGL